MILHVSGHLVDVTRITTGHDEPTVRITVQRSGQAPLDLPGGAWLELCEIVAAIEAAMRYNNG